MLANHLSHFTLTHTDILRWWSEFPFTNFSSFKFYEFDICENKGWCILLCIFFPYLNYNILAILQKYKGLNVMFHRCRNINYFANNEFKLRLDVPRDLLRFGRVFPWDFWKSCLLNHSGCRLTSCQASLYRFRITE